MQCTRRTNRTGADGRRLVAAYRSSEETQREFCARHRLSVNALRYWLRKAEVQESERTAAHGRLVEVKLVRPETAPVARMDGQRFEVVLPCGTRLQIPTGFDTREVAALLALLEAREC